MHVWKQQCNSKVALNSLVQLEEVPQECPVECQLLLVVTMPKDQEQRTGLNYCRTVHWLRGFALLPGGVL